VSFTSPYANELETLISFSIKSRLTTTENNVTANRLGGEKREMVFQNLLSQSEGELVYEAPIEVGLKQDEVVGHLVIDVYEDTGSSHQLQLFKVTAYGGAKLLDEKMGEERIRDDNTGEKVQEYYQKEFDIDTLIKARP